MNPAYSNLTDQMQTRGGLVAPKTFWNASGERRAKNCNGCGTEGWKGALVPDTIWGLCISNICDIHDWMYAEGCCQHDKRYADTLFLSNLITAIRKASEKSIIGWLLKLVRERRAFTYYQAVSSSMLGQMAFQESALK